MLMTFVGASTNHVSMAADAKQGGFEVYLLHAWQHPWQWMTQIRFKLVKIVNTMTRNKLYLNYNTKMNFFSTSSAYLLLRVYWSLKVWTWTYWCSTFFQLKTSTLNWDMKIKFWNLNNAINTFALLTKLITSGLFHR